MIWMVPIAVMLVFSVIAAFSDKEGKTLGSLAQTATVFSLIFAVFYGHGKPIFCVLASVFWAVFQFSNSNTRWRS
ncbi:hypothetical protein SAMN05216312_10860 [Cohnella sp. OV330]|uniref:hypothetical protein n=1 Tax=Cohnella sp. OV330 TaxID=1855288 RepID=UPI0008EA7554|nr:hypothetical protein [Cohnella sp. OV330]SFB43601.1 hypothetical protein SAMN05216312_10860 [Cohnella sp. OV330]